VAASNIRVSKIKNICRARGASIIYVFVLGYGRKVLVVSQITEQIVEGAKWAKNCGEFESSSS